MACPVFLFSVRTFSSEALGLENKPPDLLLMAKGGASKKVVRWLDSELKGMLYYLSEEQMYSVNGSCRFQV